MTFLSHALGEHGVVIADRNNHQRRERKQLMDDIYPVLPDDLILSFGASPDGLVVIATL
jgi:tRNA splicing ligase